MVSKTATHDSVIGSKTSADTVFPAAPLQAVSRVERSHQCLQVGEMALRPILSLLTLTWSIYLCLHACLNANSPVPQP